jgi:hypothetical protein
MFLKEILAANTPWRLLSKAKLVSTLKSNNITVPSHEIDEYFKSNTLAQIFRRPRPVPRSEHFRINALPMSFQIDIVKLVQYKVANKGIEQMLLLVDILSRKAFAFTLPSGTMADVLTVYKQFVELNKGIMSVSGDDFFSAKSFEEYNKEKNIKVFTSVARDNHAASAGNKLGIIDRLVRTIKALIEKKTASSNDPVWTGYLQEIIELYNSTPHRSLHLTKSMWSKEEFVQGSFSPNDAFTNKDFLLKLHHEYKRHNIALKEKLNDFIVGDKVRCLNMQYNLFAKEGERYSREIWSVVGPNGNGWTVRLGSEEKKVMGRDMVKVDEAGPSGLQTIDTRRVDQVVKRSKVTNKIKVNEGVLIASRVQKKPISTRIKPRIRSAVEYWEGLVEVPRSLRDREAIKEKGKIPYWMGTTGEK